MDRPQRPNRRDYKGNPAGFQLAMQSYNSAMELWQEERRSIRRAGQNRSRQGDWVPGDNGTVNGQPADIQHGNTGRVDRVDAYWPSGDPKYGHLVSNDGVNADYLREPGEDDPVVDSRS